MLSRKRGGDPEEAGISASLGDTPEKLSKGEKRVAPSTPRIGFPRKERAVHRPLTLRLAEARPHRRMGDSSW